MVDARSCTYELRIKGEVPTSSLLNAEREESLPRPDPVATHDLDRALVEAAEEIEIDWPESLPVERIKAGLTEIALALLLFAGVLALCALGRR